MRSKNIDAWQAATRKELGCDGGTPEPGCAVSYRYIAQVNRNSDEAKVFVKTALAAALVRADPRVGGLNFVGPEDYRIARADYREHMKMIGFLTKKTDTAERGAGRAARGRIVARAGAAGRSDVPHPRGGRDRGREAHRSRRRARL